MPMTQDEVLTKVQQVLVDALGVDDDEVTLEATLVDDLGAESIDFLDIVFRLEKAFGIKIDQNELFPEALLNDPQYVQDGKVTDAGVTELKKRLPHLDFSEFEKSRDVTAFSSLFTVEAIVKFVADKLKAQQG
jgi:acyl carrier protein